MKQPPPPYKIGIDLTKDQSLWIAENPKEAKALSYPDHVILRAQNEIKAQTDKKAATLQAKAAKAEAKAREKEQKKIEEDRVKKNWKGSFPWNAHQYIKVVLKGKSCANITNTLNRKGYKTYKGTPFSQNMVRRWAKENNFEFPKPSRNLPKNKTDALQRFFESLPPNLHVKNVADRMRGIGISYTDTRVRQLSEAYGYKLKRKYKLIDGNEQ